MAMATSCPPGCTERAHERFYRAEPGRAIPPYRRHEHHAGREQPLPPEFGQSRLRVVHIGPAHTPPIIVRQVLVRPSALAERRSPPGTVLIVDSVFAFRAEYNDCWEYRIWLDVDPELALRRGITRDSALEGLAEASRLHRDRYQVAEAIYLAEVRPQTVADAVIDNRDFVRPRVLDRHSF
jgi:hypothetical protein